MKLDIEDSLSVSEGLWHALSTGYCTGDGSAAKRDIMLPLSCSAIALGPDAILSGVMGVK